MAPAATSLEATPSGPCPDEDFDEFLASVMAEASGRLRDLGSDTEGAAAQMAADERTAVEAMRFCSRKPAARPGAVPAAPGRQGPGEVGSSVERDWREAVQLRKQEERTRKASEVAAAAAAEVAAHKLQDSVPASSLSPISKARAAWAAEATARDARRVAADAVRREEQLRWIASEWDPNVEARRAELRARRDAEEKCKLESAAAARGATEREAAAMAVEDADSAAFRAAVKDKCAENESLGVPLVRDPALRGIVLAVLRRLRDTLVKAEEQRTREAAAASRAAEKDREERERDYREWRAQLRKVRVAEDVAPGAAVRPPMATGIVADLSPSQPVETHSSADQRLQALLGATRKANDRKHCLEQSGVFLKEHLRIARAVADRQQQERDAQKPVRVEQDLWESLLARNRATRKDGDRWGALAS